MTFHGEFGTLCWALEESGGIPVNCSVVFVSTWWPTSYGVPRHCHFYCGTVLSGTSFMFCEEHFAWFCNCLLHCLTLCMVLCVQMYVSLEFRAIEGHP